MGVDPRGLPRRLRRAPPSRPSASSSATRPSCSSWAFPSPTCRPTRKTAPTGTSSTRDAYYLPEVRLTTEELAVLYAAGSAALASGAFPGRQDLAHALRKIGFFADERPARPQACASSWARWPTRRSCPSASSCSGAPFGARKSWTLMYWSPAQAGDAPAPGRPLRPGPAPRPVEPGRLLPPAPGRAHLPRAPHSRLTVNAPRPPSARLRGAEGLPLDDYVATWPWQHRFHQPRRGGRSSCRASSPRSPSSLFPADGASRPGASAAR